MKFRGNDKWYMIGYKNEDGSVDSIFVQKFIDKNDQVVDYYKLLYKYYRTPERVRALIRKGNICNELGIYLGDEEFQEGSPFYNEEATKLPLFIGYSDDDFAGFGDFNDACVNVKYSSVDSFYRDAINSDYDDINILLFDSKWYVGVGKEELRNVMIGFAYDGNYSKLFQLIQDLI